MSNEKDFKRFWYCNLYPVQHKVKEYNSAVLPIMKSKDNSYHYGNLRKCGSIWHCPICSRPRVIKHLENLKLLLKDWSDNDGTYHLLTLTLPHELRESLSVTNQILNKAEKRFWDSYTRGRKVRRLFDKLGFKSAIISHDTTVGKNGWHPHEHEILCCKHDKLNAYDFAQIELELRNYWAKCLEKSGAKFKKEEDKARCLRIGRGRERTEEELAEYMAKLAMEVTLSSYKKTKKDNYQMFGLLKEVIDIDDQIKEDSKTEQCSIDGRDRTLPNEKHISLLKKRFRCLELFAEYAVEMKGKHFLRYKYKDELTKNINIKDIEEIEKEISKEEKESVPVLFMWDHAYRNKLYKTGYAGHLLDLLYKNKFDDAFNLLHRLKITCWINKRSPDIKKYCKDRYLSKIKVERFIQ